MSNVEIKIATEYNGKGTKDAEKAMRKLQKTVRNLAGALGVALSARAVVQFGKASVKAFAEDEAAASKLTNTMKNLGIELSAPSMQRFIENLASATGVVDDQLRPAMQSLLQVTGSVAQSQKILAASIDVSRATGTDLSQVANDMAQAFVGNTKGLRKYNLGLTQAELKTASFADIMNRMNDLFGGASQAFLATYAGQLSLLAQAAGEAQEVIGKGIIDGLVAMNGKDADITNTVTLMQNLAQAVSDAAYGFGLLVDKVNSIPVLGEALRAVGFVLSDSSPFSGLRKLGAAQRKKDEQKGALTGQVSSALAAKAREDQAKAEKLAKARAKSLLDSQNKSLKAQKDSLKIKQMGAVFDLQQIQIAAALKGKISEDERTRLELQSALLAGNVDEAEKLVKKLAATTGIGVELRAWLLALPDAKNPFSAWKGYLDAIEAQAKRIGNTPSGALAFMGQSVTPDQLAEDPSKYVDIIVQDSERALKAAEDVLKYLGIDSPNAGTTVNVTVQGSVTSEGDLVESVRNAFLNSSLSAKASRIERNLGVFG
jgi:hypothetical protein